MPARAPQIIIDTSVIVSALRSRKGASSAVLIALDRRAVQAHLSLPLFMQYCELVGRQAEEFAYSPEEVVEVIEAVCERSTFHDIHFLWRNFLDDPGDEMVLDLAVAARAEFVVTHNVRHFRGVRRFGIEVMTPVQLLRRLEVMNEHDPR